MKKLIIASTSTVHGSGYLEYLLPTLSSFFNDVKTFFLFLMQDQVEFLMMIILQLQEKLLHTINIDVKGIHEFKNPKEAIQNAEAIFTGGGNTFELVNQFIKMMF